jgi:acyl carrier protein
VSDDIGTPAEDTRGKVMELLAEVLYLDVAKVDSLADFEELGLDSVLAVEFVAQVKAQLGVAATIESLYDWKTPEAFIEHVRGQVVASQAAS